jgi:DNA-directed RNA polymerase subunit RPC12/RpoP
LEPLSIVCTTCGRRLRVKDRRLIGQIVACPKCQGMVLVDAPRDDQGERDQGRSPTGSNTSPAGIASAPGDPNAATQNDGSSISPATDAGVSAGRAMAAGSLAVGDGDIDSEAMTREGIAAGDFSLDSVTSPKGWLDDLPPEPTKTTAGNPPVNHSTVVPPAPPDAGPNGDVVASDEDIPPIAWQSESSARVRHLAAVSAIGVITLIIAGGAFWMIVQNWRNTRTADAEVNSPLGNDSTADPAAPTIDPATGNDPTPEKSPPKSNPQGDPAGPDPAENPDVQPDLIGDGVDGDAPAVGIERDPANPPSADPSANDSATAGADNSGDRPTGDGGLFPENTSDAQAGDDFAAELPDSLKPLIKIIDFNQGGGNNPPNPVEAPPSVEELKVRFPDVVVSDSQYPPPADPVDVRTRENAKILGFVAENRPLDQVLRVIGQFVGVPIEMDLIAFDVAGMDLDQSVTVKVKDIKGMDLLKGVVRKANCDIRLDENSIFHVAPNQATIDQALSAAFALNDFGDQPPFTDSDLLRLIEGDQDTQITLSGAQAEVAGPLAIRLRAALAFEAVRKARNLPVKLAPDRLANWVRVADISDTLGGGFDWSPIPDHDVGIDADQAYAVEMIVGDLARDANAALVMDWESSWSHGFTPEATSLPWFQGRKSHAVIQQVLDPFGLTCYAVGDDVWWVGTREAYEQMRLVGVLESDYPADQTLLRIAGAVGSQPDQIAAVIDPASGKAIVYLPRFVLRKLPKLLAQ